MRYLSGLDPVLLHWDRGTFARAAGSDSHIWDAAKKRMYGPFGDGVPCIAIIGGKRRVQIEGARTVRNDDYDGWTVIGVATRTAGQADPTGGTGAYLLGSLGTIGVDGMHDTSSGYGASATLGGQAIMLKRVDTSGTFRITNAVTASLGDWRIDVSLLGNSWESVSVGHPALSVTTPFVSHSGGSSGLFYGTVGGALDILGYFPNQIEGVFPTSLIQPTSSAVTRASDSLQFAASAIPAAFTQGKWSIEVTPMFSSADVVAGDSHFIFRLSSNNNSLRFNRTGGGSLRATLTVDGTSLIISSPSWSRGQALGFEVDMPAGTVTLSGFTSGDGTVSGGSTAGWPTDEALFVGANAGTSQHFFGRMAEPRRIAA